IHTLLSKWVPPEERGTLGTFCYTGLSFGTVVMLLVSGWIATSPLGWPGIFYFSGVVSLLWALVWYFLGARSPSDCKWISVEEKLMIESTLGTSAKSPHGQAPMKTPWSKILTSVPFWVTLAAQSSYGWCFYTLLTQIPSYMNSILGQNIKSNALMSALPYLANMCLTVVFCALANFLMKRGYTSVYASRKLFNTIGLWVPVAPLILLGYMRAEQSQLALGLLVIAVGATAAGSLGFLTNHIDLSPNFGGILMGVGGFVANIMSMLSPLTVGFIVTDAKDVHQWRVVFYIVGGICFIGNLLFLLFGQTEIQSWNYPKTQTQRDPRDHIKFEMINIRREID
ncbi:putative inorganic phosphate cotransporter, partial [Rhagoletis pomonella]|uniref:putative inorganic phosphate cotransporter n=1 Tax=Rhagoletis pomonella TaxID=28610 RepID=UPI0017802626